VSNWNDSRIDRDRADLVSDILNYQDRLRFWKEVSAFGSMGLTYARTGNMDGLTEWDLLLAFFQASQLAEFQTTRSTYDELKSGGELGLIRDLELRNLLASYYTNADNPVLSERPTYREHVRGLIPLNIQNYIWENCYSSEGAFRSFLECEAPIEMTEAARLVDIISSNAQLISELRYWMSTMRVALIMGNGRTELAEQLNSIVSEMLEGSKA